MGPPQQRVQERAAPQFFISGREVPLQVAAQLPEPQLTAAPSQAAGSVPQAIEQSLVPH
jgi:hypothetical protein